MPGLLNQKGVVPFFLKAPIKSNTIASHVIPIRGRSYRDAIRCQDALCPPAAEPSAGLSFWPRTFSAGDPARSRIAPAACPSWPPPKRCFRQGSHGRLPATTASDTSGRSRSTRGLIRPSGIPRPKHRGSVHTPKDPPHRPCRSAMPKWKRRSCVGPLTAEGPARCQRRPRGAARQALPARRTRWGCLLHVPRALEAYSP